jgi:hypothetical protein
LATIGSSFQQARVHAKRAARGLERVEQLLVGIDPWTFHRTTSITTKNGTRCGENKLSSRRWFFAQLARSELGLDVGDAKPDVAAALYEGNPVGALLAAHPGCGRAQMRSHAGRVD